MGTPPGLFALNQAHRAGDFKSKFTGCVDRLNRGSARGADIVHDHHARALLPEALDPLSRAVLLLAFADEKAVNLAAGNGHRHHDWIGAHRQPPNGLWPPSALTNFLEKDLAGEL